VLHEPLRGLQVKLAPLGERGNEGSDGSFEHV
jgi:hypothetical protein